MRKLLALLLLVPLIAGCPSSEAKANDLFAQAAAALHENDPTRALALYDRALAATEKDSEIWHKARWQRLHALAGAEPSAVPAELERLLREDARRVAPLEIHDLAFKMCLAGEPAGIAVFESGMNVLGVPEFERESYHASLEQTLELARAPR